MTSILVVEDDPAELRLLCGLLADMGYTPLPAAGGDAALARLRGEERPAAMLLDLVMPERDGMAVLDAMARENLAVPAIVLCSGSEDAALPAIRRGALDFVTKPVRPERLLVALRNALRLVELEGLVKSAQHRQAGTPGLSDLVAGDEAMLRARAQLAKAARTDLPVLLEGEAGTGKALAARLLHATSERAGRPLRTFDCAALSARDGEAVLFGDGTRPGLLREAHGGTLYLENAGALAASIQARLLRLLETGSVAPAGARPERVNVRLVAGSRSRLLNLARAGRLLEGLYYRLNVMPIYLPPLRQRPADIAPLARRALLRAAAEAGRRIDAIAPDALALLCAHDWPGNVAQLERAVWRAVALAEGARLDAADFPELLRARAGREGILATLSALPPPSAPVHVDSASLPAMSPIDPVPDRFVDEAGAVAPLETVERDLIAFALERHRGHMSRVARTLGIGRSTLYRKIRQYGLEDGLAELPA